MQIRPTAFTIGLIIHFSIALFCVYTEFGIDSCIEHKNLILLFDKNNLMYRIQQKLNDAIPVKLEELMAFGFVPTEFFCGFDSSYQILFNIGGIWNVICRWAHGGMEDDPKQLIEELSKYIVTLGEYAKKGVSPFQKVAK